VLMAARCKYRTQKVAKNRHLGTIVQLLRIEYKQSWCLRRKSGIGERDRKGAWVGPSKMTDRSVYICNGETRVSLRFLHTVCSYLCVNCVALRCRAAPHADACCIFVLTFAKHMQEKILMSNSRNVHVFALPRLILHSPSLRHFSRNT